MWKLKTTLWKVLHRQAIMKNYKPTMNHKLEHEDCPKWKNFQKKFQAQMDNDETIAQHLIFMVRRLSIPAAKLVVITCVCARTRACGGYQKSHHHGASKGFVEGAMEPSLWPIFLY
jgi:hypothetical protein